MNIWSLVTKEVLHRKLNFGLGLLSVVIAVACLVGALTLLRAHDLRTDQIIASKQAETKEKMEKLIISIDRHVKEVEVNENKSESIRLLDKLIKKYKALIALKKANPDLPVTMEACKKAINSAEAARRNIKKL